MYFVEFKTKEMEVKSPKNETEIEVEDIYERHTTGKPVLKVSEKRLEQQLLIRQFKENSVGKIKLNDSHLNKMKLMLDKTEDMYQVHERRMREKSIIAYYLI